MGKMAVDTILEGHTQNAIVVRDDRVQSVPLSDCSEKSDHAMKEFVGIAEDLSI